MKPLYLLGLLSLIGGLPALAAVRKAAPDDGPAAAAAPMNEISGTIESIDTDAQVIRLTTETGYNVQFSYDRATVCKGIGVPQAVSELAFKDRVIVRYAGRDLIAREIEKRNLQPAVAASTPPAPAN